MAIYYLDVKPIGGNSCRSAVGAAAYRKGEKLYNEHDGITHDYRNRRGAVGAAAYRLGERLHDSNDMYDFTSKSGIVYSEIILPEHAPRAFQDSGTLWNSAQKAERNCNARTGREIVVALPNELTTEQHIKLLRDYVQKNFVGEGMCSDFSIHSGHIHEKKGEVYPFQDLTVRKDNPHAHIQLTVRPLNKDGTWGAKAEKEYILDKNGNRIKLESGEWKSRKIELTDWDKTKTLLKWRENWATTVNKEFERLGIDERIDHRTLKEQGIDREPTKHMGHNAWNLEKKGIKTTIGDENRDIMKRNAERHISPEVTAEYMHELKQGYVILDKEISAIKQETTEIRRDMLFLRFRTEDITEHAEQIHTLGERLEELKTQRREMGFFRSKKAIDEQIRRVEYSYEQAEINIKRLEYEINDMKRIQEQLNDKLNSFIEDKETFALEYQRQKLLAEISPDRQRIQDKLRQLSKEQPKQDEILWKRGERTLDIVTERNFKAILNELTPEQVKILTAHREREREQEHAKTMIERRGYVRERVAIRERER